MMSFARPDCFRFALNQTELRLTRESCYGLGLRLITPWLTRNYTYLGSNTGNYGLENALLRPEMCNRSDYFFDYVIDYIIVIV